MTVHGTRTVRLSHLADLRRDLVDPSRLSCAAVDHFSIPAFDVAQEPERCNPQSIKSHKFSVTNKDVLVSRLNPRFSRVWVPHVDPKIPAIASTEFMVLRPRDGVNREALAVLLESETFTSAMRGRVTGTSGSHQRVKHDDALAIEVPAPSQEWQTQTAVFRNAVANALAVRRLAAENLHRVGHILFEAWFVRHESVQLGGQRGRAPTGEELMTLREGKVPRGWKRAPLGDFVAITRGVSYKSSELQSSPVALVTLKSFDRRGGYRCEGLKEYTGEYSENQILSPGDIAVAHTDLTQAAEVLGRAIRVPSHHEYSVLVASLDLAVVRPIRPLTREYVFHALARQEFRDHAYGYANGTTVLHLSNSALREYKILVPPADVVEGFTDLAMQFYAAEIVRKGSCTRLSELRSEGVRCLNARVG